ncbi:hypothetical protein [Limnoglobus roseus]|nr:hypothetical protein [Limnoglobus roseus]
MAIVATGRLVPTPTGTDVIVSTRPHGWVLFLLCVVSPGIMARLFWERLVNHPSPQGLMWGEVCFILACGLILWPAFFIGGTIEEREYERALERIVMTDPSRQK